MSKLKICGIKDAKTLQLLAELEVDYAGFVFAPSKRQVTPEQAEALLSQVEKVTQLVGVFVNPDHALLAETLAKVPLDVIQLHGDETVEFIQQIKKQYPCQIWKAIRVKEKAQVQQMVEQYRPYIDAFLLDAYHPSQTGGTGERFSWSDLPVISEMMQETPYFIAGGIDLSNVDELLGLYQAQRIDVSSGVETDGQKDPKKIRDLVERVQRDETNS